MRLLAVAVGGVLGVLAAWLLSGASNPGSLTVLVVASMIAIGAVALIIWRGWTG